MANTFLEQTPIRMGTTAEFASVAGVLKDASFDEETICRLFNLKDMSDVGEIERSDVDRANASEQLKILARLFLLPEIVPRSEVESAFESSAINSFLALGLLGCDDFGQDAFYARALLYPVAGFIVASDRHSLPDGSQFEPPSDIVFPAIFGGTLEFLKLLPTKWQGDALDLCSGTGIGAFALSRSGRCAVAADITERATDFARFNCALNNLRNVEVQRSDLYAAVNTRTFSCIVAHPPYVPSLETKAIWRDGGVTGEALVKRIIESLPQYLQPGGIFLSLSLGADTDEQKFEGRARHWLGTAADEFDIIFACKEVREPHQVLENLAHKHAELGPENIKKFESEFERLRVVQMPFGALCLKRAANPRQHKGWTIRTLLNDDTNGSSFEKAFTNLACFGTPTFILDLPQTKPRLAPDLEVKITHVVEDNSLAAADALFAVDQPFAARVRFEPWMVPLLARLDGQTTVAKIYDDAKANRSIPEEFKLENFAVLVAHSIERGFTILE